MPKEYSRITRIADVMQQELVTVFQQEIADPRLRFITITVVKVSRDLAFADIFYTQLDWASLQGYSTEKADKTVTLKLLKKAATRLRYLLSQRLELRLVPVLRFFYDDQEVQSQRLHHLIDQAVGQDNSRRSG